jgi:hypothetical protein
VRFFNLSGCRTQVGQYTASFNSALPSGQNNVIESYTITCS